MSFLKLSENGKIIRFIVIICTFCALILAALASLLQNAQEKAFNLDLSQQMLISAKILSYQKNFLIKTEQGSYAPATYDSDKNILIPSTKPIQASDDQILEVYSKKIVPMLVDEDGNSFTFTEKNIDYTSYIKSNQKNGYADLPLKLIYQILSISSTNSKVIGYIIPVNGFGLWGPIYGYLAIENDGNTVIGTTWYQQNETAGLGANISNEEWQSQFGNKVIFQTGDKNLKTAPLGITVVKGRVIDIYKNSPKAKSAIDGISGATLTGKGVTLAYKDSLSPYRPFFIKAHQNSGTSNES